MKIIQLVGIGLLIVFLVGPWQHPSGFGRACLKNQIGGCGLVAIFAITRTNQKELGHDCWSGIPTTCGILSIAMIESEQK